MRPLSEEMQLFLVSTVFGYDMKEADENEENLRRACIGRAYLDLARVIPYKFSTNYVDQNRKDQNVIDFLTQKDCFKKTVGDILFNMEPSKKPGEIIEQVYNCANREQYREAVFKTEEDGKFTYGMAQKWVNMFRKYMWLFSAKDWTDEREYEMPIDSYIIDALYNKKVLTVEKCNKNEHLKALIGAWNGNVGKNSRPSDYIKKWSNWNQQEYEAVQGLISNNKPEHKTILCWENELWMNQSKILRAKGS